MHEHEPAGDPARRHARRTAWIVGVVALAIYLGAILAAALR